MFGSTSKELTDEFIMFMRTEFEMSMIGELNFFLGLHYKHISSGLFQSQSKYAHNLVKKFGLRNGKIAGTPMSATLRITKDEKGKSVHQHEYRSMISGLLYVMASRPDIAYSVGVCARYQVNPKESYKNTVKLVLKYVNTL